MNVCPLFFGISWSSILLPSFNDLICTFASTNITDISLTSWNGRGTCMDLDYLRTRLAYQFTLKFTLTYVISLCPESFWPWIKKYNKHYWEIENTLMHYGHLAETKSTIYSYTIVIGDPTVVILSNPLVSLAFMIDIAWSYPMNVIAMLRASQNDDITTMLIAFLYLSRTVWFSYLNMPFMNIFLKHFKKEYLMDDIDPTIVAIYSILAGAVLTYSIGNFAPLLVALHTLQTAMVP
ncbi:hypothetical protein THRCLA_09048 [Thraustotheca clavata]|uniref:Uncharacterized protein n=1 Tax=Thraustotheca clavata TaxID=74557 RepID=A0A1V9YZW8_9STRA|nr:hypothetical protein THRCLA_09048 [Thraustotheca clavata]